MELTPYLAAVADDLEKVTALAEPTTQETARRLATALEPALRLALVRAITDTAAQVSAEIGEGAVTVHLRDGDPVLSVVGMGAAPAPAAAPLPALTPLSAPAPGSAGADGLAADDDLQDDTPSRISLRLPDSLKRRVEERADRAGLSTNTWITQALRRAVTEGDQRAPRTSRSISGWA